MIKEPIFVTTFNHTLYKNYAYRLINSYISTKQKFKLIVFTEDKMNFSNKNIVCKNILKCEPELKKFIENNKHRKFNDYKNDAVRFSYKVFSIFAAKKISEKTFFIDADCIFLKKIDKIFADKFLPKSKCISFYFRENKHAETGFFALNNTNLVTQKFLTDYKKIYTSNEIYNYNEQHDGFIFSKLINKYEKNYPNLIKKNGDKNKDHIIAADNLVNNYLDHTKGELRKYLGYSPELKKIKKSIKKVYIIYPEINKPWKYKNFNKLVYKVSKDNKIIRSNWLLFVKKIKEKIHYYNKNIKVICCEYPLWKINSSFLNKFKNDILLVPHRSRDQFKGLKNRNIFFYMQDLNVKTFTIDKNGWSSKNSSYPINLKNIPITNLNLLNEYSNNFQTKYSQNKNIFKKVIFYLKKPKNYILIPIQIPRDESLRHSTISVEHFLEKIIKFCKKKKIIIILKPHPANLNETKKFKIYCDNKYIFWSENDLMLLIKNSKGIITINSAVGFEGILHKKPVVTFGKSLYDCVSFRGNINKLNSSIHYINNFNIKEKINNYKKFTDWFLGLYSFNLNDEKLMLWNSFKILNSYQSKKKS